MIETSYKDFLESESLGTFGTNLFIRQMPDSPDNAICVFLSTAPQGVEHLRYDLNNTGVKVMVRGSHSFCETKITAIDKVIHQFTGTYNSIEIEETLMQTPWTFVENDDKGRAVYTATFESEYSIGATSR